ncbi:hypothetical protein MMC11_009053 [Xylographa trunciseda]|nr:hypothetical protein [Xylographa trunciseda]
MASGGAPPPPPPHNNKGKLPADKIWDPPESEEEEGDTIVVAEEAPRVTKPQAGKGKGPHKRTLSAAVSGEVPSWAMPGPRGDSKHRRLARDILGEPSTTYPVGRGCSDCVARSRLCVVREDRTKCASCTAQGAKVCDWNSGGVGVPTANQMTIRPRVSQASTTQAAPAARVRPPVTTGAVRRPSPWTSSNEDLAEMLGDVEAGANPGALLRTVVGSIIELREAAHLATVPPTDHPGEGDSGAEEEEEEGEEEGVGGGAAGSFGGGGGEEEDEDAVVAAGLDLAESFLGSWSQDSA